MGEYKNVIGCLNIVDTLDSILGRQPYSGSNELALRSLLLIRRKLNTSLEDCQEAYPLSRIYAILSEALKTLKSVDPDMDEEEASNRFRKARLDIRRCWNIMAKSDKQDSPILNSEELYKKLIDEAQREKEKLACEIEKIKQEQSSAQEDKKLLREKEAELEQTQTMLNQYKEQEKEKQIRDDAVATWKKKITDTFGILDGNISPIKTEHSRLRFLYWSYNILSAITIAVLIGSELAICAKIHNCAGFPSPLDYISLILPIPIAVGLLWGFVTQANRAQRQMVVLSRFIHDIKYTEGILLAINNLSTDVADSTQRINNALDKLLDKHLSHDLLSLHREDMLRSEEEKDSLPVETVADILKRLRK